MDRAKYDMKLQDMLDDTNVYEKLKRDPSQALERKMNSMLLDLNRKKELPSPIYYRLRSSNGMTPLLYGLPKIHKADVPMRPIVSFIHSPTYQLSKHLCHLLSPLVGHSDSSVWNSKQFVEFISDLYVQEDEMMASFDVVSLFTNVPRDLAIEVPSQRLALDESLQDRTNLCVQSIVSLLSVCLEATYLSFRGQYYKQKIGTAMGSPVSVTVANMVMEEIEERALSTFRSPPRFWKHYVDDTCTVLRRDVVSEFHKHLNSIHPSIQFTMEEEEDRSLPFLDVLLERKSDGTVHTSVFRKPTNTDKYLDFRSHHPLSHKVSVIRTLYSRAVKLSTTSLLRTSEEEHIIKALEENGYTQYLVRRVGSGCESKTSTVVSPDDQEPIAKITLPYIRSVSDSIARILRKLNISVSFRPHRTLWQSFVHVKDEIPAEWSGISARTARDHMWVKLRDRYQYE